MNDVVSVVVHAELAGELTMTNQSFRYMVTFMSLGARIVATTFMSLVNTLGAISTRSEAQ